MLFTIITVLALAGVFVRQTWRRFAQANARPEKISEGTTWSAYRKWLGSRLKSTFTRRTYRRSWAVLSDWARAHYPGWTKWIFAGFGLSLATRVLMDVSKTGRFGSPGEFGWEGAFTTYFWIDPVEALFGIVAAQYTPIHFPLFRRFKQLTYQAMV